MSKLHSTKPSKDGKPSMRKINAFGQPVDPCKSTPSMNGRPAARKPGARKVSDHDWHGEDDDEWDDEEDKEDEGWGDEDEGAKYVEPISDPCGPDEDDSEDDGNHTVAKPEPIK